MATGAKSARITPAEGLAFLTSAISFIGRPAASGEKKSRAGGASASAARSSASGRDDLARSISIRFVATILSRIVGMYFSRWEADPVVNYWAILNLSLRDNAFVAEACPILTDA